MNFVLVHGAWLGAWCWEAVTEELRNRGHNVAVPELAGHGSDTTPPSEITLDGYVQTVGKSVAAWNAPVTLIGHSMAGAVISQTAEIMPDKISRLVYVAAYLLRAGETILQASQQADDSLVSANMIVAPDQSTVSIRQEGLRDVFCADAPPEVAQKLVTKARPEPAAPFNTSLKISAGRWGAVPRAYIKTMQDRAVTLKLQTVMLERTPCDEVLSIDTSHTPFLSQPAELSQLIVHAASEKREQAKGV